MINTITATAISSITSLIVGYLIKTLANYKKRDDTQNTAIRNILKSDLVNQYYVYAELGKVPRYVAQALYSMYESYVQLGGNSFIKHSIEPKFAKLKIIDED